jgi:hypothetical protein
MGTGSYLGVKSGRDMTLTPHPLLVPLSRKGRAITLFPLWAVRLYRTSVPVQIPDAVDTVVCAPDDGWNYHPIHVEQFPDINNLRNVACCWIYEYIGIL